jgi:tRNA dimethylallyltransferase
LVLVADVDWLNDRIARRFAAMISAGAVEEARSNLAGWDPMRPSSRAIGGPELIAHVQGQLSLPDAIDSATLASRQYAKRQRTWFRSNMSDWTPLYLP